MVRSASAVCLPPPASARRGSSPSAATRTARTWLERFGATDIVAERGEAATEAVMALTNGVGVDATLECVGTRQSMATAFAITRPGAMVGYVGVPHGVEVPLETMFYRNVGMHGGSAPVRTYIRELMKDVLGGPHRSGPRPRLRDRPRRHRGGLRGHG